MSREDMILLIKAGDALWGLGDTLQKLTGTSYADGEYQDLDNICEVILHSSHRYYAENKGNYGEDAFWKILGNDDLSAEERADLLLGGSGVGEN